MPPDTSPPRHALANLWRIRFYIRPYLSQLVAMTAAAGVGVGASIVIPLVTRQVVDGPVRDGDSAGLVLLGLLALALGVVEAAMTFMRRWIQASAAVGMETTIRTELYAHLQRLPVAFHDRWQTGQLVSRITTDLGVIRRFLSFGLIFLLINIVTYVTVVVLLVQLYWPLGLMVAAGAFPLMWICMRLERQYLSIARRVQDQQGDLATFIEESAVGVRTVKAFGRRRQVLARFEADARTLHDSSVGKARLVAKFWALLDLVPNVMLATVLLVGSLAVAREQLTLGELLAFVALMLMLVWPIDALGWILATGQEAMTAADRLYEIFDTEPAIVDRPGAVALGGTGSALLRFEGVGFRYPDAAEPMLHDVHLDVRPGETVALVGATGSGKTTLAALVPRLYDVTDGRVTLDGQDIRDLRLDSLRHVVAMAFEEPTLFSASVRENLTLGRPEATEDEVTEALRIAQAEFAYDLPWGLDTRIGEQGMSLSGGQRQRLALARAVLGRPRVLVLDDPLSALDVHTEALVEEALARVLADTTALLVVHRPSTVALADRVALIEDGTITAIGTHAQLMADLPNYRAVLSATEDASPAGDEIDVAELADVGT